MDGPQGERCERAEVRRGSCCSRIDASTVWLRCSGEPNRNLRRLRGRHEQRGPADLVYPDRVELTAGRALGPYQIVEKVGAGGMGSVYRARDTRLDRSVAIKVLPEELSQDPRLRERLAQEAKSISALSHPNICGLYDIGHQDGIDFLVMEFLEGETLADRIMRTGALRMRQALAFGADIAAALDAAHRGGVIHRDLKPGNIMLTRSGARLLDFGLARQAIAEIPQGEASGHATERMPLTDPGSVVGTLQYMSPEQAEGRRLDFRSDIFSFGAVLYEMLSGKRAFEGPTRVSVLHAIAQGQPRSLLEAAPAVPESVERVVRKCLEKSPDDRWQSAHDLSDELKWVAGMSSGAVARSAPRGAERSRWLAVALAAVLVAAAFGTALMMRQRRHDDGEGHGRTLRFGIDPPAGSYFTQRATNTEFAVSPDGRQIVLTALQGGRRSLYLRRLDELAAREIDGTEGAVSPFWSPDGNWIGYFSNGLMRKIPSSGGPAQSICAAHGGTATWGAKGTILFAEWGPDTPEEIQAVSELGGAPTRISAKGGWRFWPMFLSDSRHYLFHLHRGNPAVNGIYLGSLDDSKTVRLLAADSRVEVAEGNWLYFVDQGILRKQQLDVAGARMKDAAVTVANSLFTFTPTGAANFSVDRAGDLVAYQRAPSETQLVWRNMDGHETARLKGSLRLRKFRLSPDGERVALDLFDLQTGVSSVWLYEMARDVVSRVTTNPSGTYSPIWTRDGRELVVADIDPTHTTMPPQLARLSPSGTILKRLNGNDGLQYPTDLTPDGRFAIYTVNRGTHSDIELLSMSGDRGKVPLESSQFNESDGSLSPDGKWLVFVSDQTARPEVYVRPFPSGGERIRISSDGGTEPRWSPRGSDVFYVGPDGTLTRVPVSPGDPIRISRPLPLFHITSAGMMENHEFGFDHYDIAADGQHFLVRELAQGTDEAPVVVMAGGLGATK